MFVLQNTVSLLIFIFSNLLHTKSKQFCNPLFVMTHQLSNTCFNPLCHMMPSCLRRPVGLNVMKSAAQICIFILLTFYPFLSKIQFSCFHQTSHRCVKVTQSGEISCKNVVARAVAAGCNSLYLPGLDKTKPRTHFGPL